MARPGKPKAEPRSRTIGYAPPPRSGTKSPVWARLLGANGNRSERRGEAMNYEGNTILP